jgi:hypothetical protein
MPTSNRANLKDSLPAHLHHLCPCFNHKFAHPGLQQQKSRTGRMVRASNTNPRKHPLFESPLKMSLRGAQATKQSLAPQRVEIATPACGRLAMTIAALYIEGYFLEPVLVQEGLTAGKCSQACCFPWVPRLLLILLPSF